MNSFDEINKAVKENALLSLRICLNRPYRSIKLSKPRRRFQEKVCVQQNGEKVAN